MCLENIRALEGKQNQMHKKRHYDERCSTRNQSCSPPAKNGRRELKTSSEPTKSKKDTSSTSKSGTYLETFITTVTINGQSVMVRGVLDGGSNTPYVHINILNKLGIRPTNKFSLSVQSFGYSAPTSTSCVEVVFTNTKGAQKQCSLLTVDDIVGNASLSPSCEEASYTLPYNFDYADPDLFIRF